MCLAAGLVLGLPFLFFDYPSAQSYLQYLASYSAEHEFGLWKLFDYSRDGRVSTALPARADQISFEFSPDGKLARVAGMSGSGISSYHSADPEFDKAIHKGKNESFDYRAGAPELAVISGAVLGRDNTTAVVDFDKTLRAVLDRVKRNDAIDIPACVTL